MDVHPDDELVAKFVAIFCELDDSQFFTHEKPPPDEMNAGMDPTDWQRILWRPASVQASDEELRDFRNRLETKLPPLYERLITSWRWQEVCLYKVRLLENPPGAGLGELAPKMLNDPVFVQHLVANGFVPFGFYTREDSKLFSYDPVCFDTRNRRPDGDCPIVAFEHEAMLSSDRIGESWKLWDSFRELVVATIEFADRRSAD